MNVIMIRPKHDNDYVTKTLNSWAADAIGDVRPQLSDDLNGKLAAESNLRQSLQNNPTAELIAFYGHGEDDYLIGHGSSPSTRSPVIHTNAPGVRPQELTGRHLYAVACWAGLNLGPALANNGCRFVGYGRKFGWPPGFEADFEQVVNKGLVAWVSGKTNTEILAQLREDWKALEKDLTFGSKCEVPNAFLAALAAHWNHDYLCSH